MFAEKVKRMMYDFIGAWHKTQEGMNRMVKERRRLGRWLAAFIITSLLAALALPLLSPVAAEAAVDRPVNISPLSGTMINSLTPTLQSSAFSEPNSTATHLASQWQISTSGSYSSPIFDSQVDYNDLTSIQIPLGILSFGTTYYWHVKYVDSSGNWSSWSTDTFFTIATSGPPTTPINVSPLNGTTDISLTPTLQSSAFLTSHAGDHAASQWQIRTASGNYSSPVFDSGVDTLDLTTITIPAAPPVILRVNTTYYWRVRHQDSYGNWSNWSTETSFKTIVSANPSTPINMSPVNGATSVSLTPTLQSSAFVSPDGGATQAASQWQVTTIPGNYTPPALIYDSDVDTNHLTQLGIVSGTLKVNTNYYWRVRHQDSYGNWSGWSTETSFKTIVSGNPSTPINISPVNGAFDTSLTPILQSSAFASLDGGATHTASRWQIRTSSGSYSSPMFDSGVDTNHFTQIGITSGILKVGTSYYWRVRHQDSYGNWSDWSTETFFTTIAGQPPVSPTNSLPANGATGIGTTPTLSSSAFSDPDVGDSHQASQWQIRTASGNYTNPVFDSGVDITNLTQIAIPSGILSVNTTYYWHVRYQDSYGNWSGWSNETSFATISEQAPVTPSNSSPTNGLTGISVTPMLTSSAFSDPDVGDSHQASQWQVRTTSGNYSSPLFNSGTDIIDKTSMIIPSGTLSYNTTYYWRVRHQDSYGYWSSWSTETSFTTVVAGIPSRPSNVSPADGTTGIVLTPTLRASIFDDPGDTHTASQWQITITSGNYSGPVFDSGVDTASFSQITIFTDVLDYDTVYYWHVRYQDSDGDWSAYSAETSFTTVTLSKWTFMVYLDADNNLGWNSINDFNQMELVGSTDDVNIVVLMDTLNTTARLFRVTQDSDVNVISSTAIADWGEVDMGNPRTLEDFATWAMENQPAQHYVLVLWDHGDVRGVCWDDTNGGDYLTEAEIQQALRAIKTDTEVTLDIVGFDACLMGMAEIDYQIRECANIAVGSQELTYGWPYYDILRSLTADPNMTPTELARQIVQDYGEYWDSFAPLLPGTSYTQSAVQLSGSTTLADCVSDFAQSLMDSEEWHNIVTARNEAEEFYHPDYGYGYVDLYHFASLVHSLVSDNVVQTKAQNVMDTISGMVLAETHDPMIHSNAHGISIFFPESQPASWDDYCRELDFSGDTQWDEFLLAYWAAITLSPLPPNTPSNVSPSGATDISLTPTLSSSAFSAPDTGGTHAASQWQITTISGNYTTPAKIYDSGTDIINKTSIIISSGPLSYNTTYYWRVRYQDSYYNWSGWSTGTSFTTALPRSPQQPAASSPRDRAPRISLTPTLESSAFSATDAGDIQAASQWQISGESGNYSSPVFNSGTDTVHLTKITIPTGILHYGTTYYWRVRHQDRYGIWSDYSPESCFTTVVTPPPQQPTARSPEEGDTGISLTPTLESSAFFSADEEATHTASQWQITTTSGDYSSPVGDYASLVFDSGVGTTALTQITIPSSGNLSASTTYYWRVRYRDSYGTWSDYSAEVSFTTVSLVTADFSAVPVQAAPGQTVTFTDTSTGNATSWVWDFGDETTAVWNTTTRPGNGKVTHSYSTAGNYTTSLKVSGPTGENTKTKTVLIQVPTPTPPSGEGLPWIYIIIGIVVVLAIGGGIFWYLRRRG